LTLRIFKENHFSLLFQYIRYIHYDNQLEIIDATLTPKSKIKQESFQTRFKADLPHYKRSTQISQDTKAKRSK